MQIDFDFLITGILLGVGLAMDAFSVAVVNALNEPDMKKGKALLMSSVYGGFQAFMPLAGWFCVHTIIGYFAKVQPYIPWVSLILLAYIGTKMLLEGFGIIKSDDSGEAGCLTVRLLLLQAVATSIDALSVGFTISEYNFGEAFLAALIIGIVTFAISCFGVCIGRRVGDKLSGKASAAGGIILIIIGIKICFFG